MALLAPPTPGLICQPVMLCSKASGLEPQVDHRQRKEAADVLSLKEVYFFSSYALKNRKVASLSCCDFS